jgi:hypothetical protein
MPETTLDKTRTPDQLELGRRMVNTSFEIPLLVTNRLQQPGGRPPYQRARKRYLGGTVPFGWRVGEKGELVEVPEQQIAIQRMKEFRRAGRSLRSIAAEMAEAGHQLSHQGVKEIVGGGATGCDAATRLVKTAEPTR